MILDELLEEGNPITQRAPTDRYRLVKKKNGELVLQNEMFEYDARKLFGERYDGKYIWVDLETEVEE